MEIRRYRQEYKTQWDGFVEESKNGTFLFKRDYMEYHADRFEDYSLMFLQDKKLYAVLPANIKDKTLYSHQGLTYGGLVTSSRCTATMVIAIFDEMNNYLRGQGIERVVYKPVPVDYHRYPAQEDLYALFNHCGARLTQRNLSSVVDLRSPLKWNRDRRYGLNKAMKNGTIIEESHNYASFWKVLENNLHDKYDSVPVHSLKEIELLSERFPKNIKLITARIDNEIVAGTVLYLMPPVAHAQYISANAEGKKMRVIDAMFHFILRKCDGYDYFDFGTSNEDAGRRINESLIYQKEGFGGRGICYDTYEYEL